MKLILWPTYALKNEWGCIRLNPQEGLVMTALFSHKEVSQEEIVEILWPDPRWQPDQWRSCIKGVLTMLRRKLLRLRGPSITVRRGYGWSLTDS